MIRLNTVFSLGVASSANTLLKDNGETGFFIKLVEDSAVRFKCTEGNAVGFFFVSALPDLNGGQADLQSAALPS